MVLGVTPMASKDAIKKAYRELAKQYHPDVNPDLTVLSQEKMKEITEAYDVLTDADQRKEYDGQPQFKIRVPTEFHRLAAGSRDQRPSRSSIWDRLKGLFGRPGDTVSGEQRNLYQMHFSAAVTCAQFPGGKMLSQAEIDFSRALSARPDSVDAQYDLALVHYWQGKYPEALTGFRAVLTRAPEDGAARRMVELLQQWER